MKHLANILTASRFVLAIILLAFFREISVLFLIIYTVAELTDMIDGTIARKTNSCSPTGALLDSIADFTLNASLIKVVFSMKLMNKKLSFWLFSALLIGIISPIINLYKHKKIFFIHSISCKISGGMLILIPFAIYFGFFTPYLKITLAIITFAMIEIVIMSILLKDPDPDSASIYSIIKQNRFNTAKNINQYKYN